MVSSSEEIAELGYFSREEIPEGFGAGGRAKVRDAFSGQLGFVRAFDPITGEYR